MCGGPSKSSLFEMHMCGNSMDEAGVAAGMAAEAAAKSTAAVSLANNTVEQMKALVGVWDLGVCSVKPEGERVCSLKTTWLEAAGTVTDAVNKAVLASTKLADAESRLASLSEAAKGEMNASTATDLELTTTAVRDAAAKTIGMAAGVELAVAQLAGPIGGAPSDGFAATFSALGDTANGWHAMCALVPIPHEMYSGLADDNPALCARRCLTLSGGLAACKAFNYQYKDGLASCQLLTGDGLASPESSLAQAVPVFEVSNSSRDAMGITSLDCFAHGAFMAGHPRGPLKTEVLREITTG